MARRLRTGCSCSCGGGVMVPLLMGCSECIRNGMWGACVHCMLWVGVGPCRSSVGYEGSICAGMMRQLKFECAVSDPFPFLPECLCVSPHHAVTMLSPSTALLCLLHQPCITPTRPLTYLKGKHGHCTAQHRLARHPLEPTQCHSPAGPVRGLPAPLRCPHTVVAASGIQVRCLRAANPAPIYPQSLAMGKRMIVMSCSDLR